MKKGPVDKRLKVIRYRIPLGLLLGSVVIYLTSTAILGILGNFIVIDEKPIKADAIVILNTGVEYYPRLIEAASLYRKGFAGTVVINGNRKTDVLRQLEEKGFEACCPWFENSLRILSLYGVPRDRIVPISAEDAYDTVSEARVVGAELLRRRLKRIILTTSKYHSRRAGFIWQKTFANQLSVITITAKTDPYDPDRWWKEGRQIRWVLAEYGAWIFYYWKRIKNL